MTEFLRQTEKLTDLIIKLHALIDCEQEPKTRMLLSNIKVILEDQDNSNKIIDAQTIILQRHNLELTDIQRTSDKSRIALVMTLFGIAQILIIGVVSYVFSNTQKIMEDNMLLVQETQHLNEKIVQHQAVTDNMMRSFKFSPPIP